MPGPLPRWLTGCVCPLLPLSHRPSPKMHWVGSTTIPRSTTSERAELTRLQSVVDLQASEFACHPDRSHRWPPMWVPGRPWRLHPSRTRFVTSPRIGYASRPNRAIDGRGLPPPGSAALLAAPHSFPVRSEHEPCPVTDAFRPTDPWQGRRKSSHSGPRPRPALRHSNHLSVLCENW